MINLSQRRTPDALQGRVAATITLALFAPQPLAHLAGALAVDHVSYQALYGTSAAVTLATAAWLYRGR